MRRLACGLVVTAVLASIAGCSLSLDGYAGPELTDAAMIEEADGAPGAPADGETPSEEASALDASEEQVDAAPTKPILFVQQAANKTDASNTSFSVPYTAPVADHDTLIVALYVSGPNAALSSVTDTLGNSFQVLCSQEVDAYQTTVYVLAAYDVIGGTSDTVTMHSTTSAQTNLLLHEYANIAPGAGVCTHAIGDSTAVDGIQAPPITTTVPNEMIFDYTISGVVAPGTGFTARSTFDGDLTEDRIVPTPSAVQATATVQSGGPAWAIVAAEFKPR